MIAVLTAVISNNIEYFPHVVGIAFINGNLWHRHQLQLQHRHAIECFASQGYCPKQLLFCSPLFSPNAAQQCHDVGFVHVDGAFEGDMAVTAGKRVGRKHANNNNTTK